MTEPKNQVQEFRLEGHSYRLIVEISLATGAQWQAVGVKDGKEFTGIMTFGSEAQAKKSIHQIAHADAGINDHFCDESDCFPWNRNR